MATTQLRGFDDVIAMREFPVTWHGFCASVGQLSASGWNLAARSEYDLLGDCTYIALTGKSIGASSSFYTRGMPISRETVRQCGSPVELYDCYLHSARGVGFEISSMTNADMVRVPDMESVGGWYGVTSMVPHEVPRPLKFMDEGGLLDLSSVFADATALSDVSGLLDRALAELRSRRRKNRSDGVEIENTELRVVGG